MGTSQRELKKITGEVVDAAIQAHKALGPGLPESAYEACLAFELGERNLVFERQKQLPVRYKRVEVKVGYRIDLVLEKSVLVEVKAVERVLPVRKAQIMSYLGLSEIPLGLLLNVNVPLMRKGIHRFVQGDFSDK